MYPRDARCRSRRPWRGENQAAFLAWLRADFFTFVDKHPELRAKIGTIATSREEDNRRRRERNEPLP